MMARKGRHGQLRNSYNGEILALLPDGPGVIAWGRSADGERRVFLLDFLSREAWEM